MQLAAVLDAVLDAVLAVVGPAAATAPDDVGPDVAAGAGAESMMHKARGECWVQQVSKVLTTGEVVAAAAGGDEGETVWFGTMSCVSERIAGADLVRGFFAKLERADAKMVG